MTGTTRPLLAITMGDPAGIGPEVVLKALAHADVFERCRPLVIGDRRILERAADWLGKLLSSTSSRTRKMGSYEPGRVTLLDLENALPDRIPVGEESAAAGAAAVEYVFRACDLAMAGEVDAVVTAPLNKAAMHLAGYKYAGHTELLTERTGAKRVSMLLIGPNCASSTSAPTLPWQRRSRASHRNGSRMSSTWPTTPAEPSASPGPASRSPGSTRMPSEGGMFGDEETEHIEPAIRAARARGLDVSDPQPPDTVFLRATGAHTTSSSPCTTIRGTSR